MAGLVVAIVLVPQSMAYALLAGLPPQIGLYAALIPPILYGLLGSSRYLAVGPVAIVALLIADGLAPLASGGTDRYLQLAVLLALMVGVIQLAMGVFRAGFIAGFTSGAAIVIAVSQIDHLFGVDVARTDHPHQTVVDLIGRLDETVLETVLVGLVALVLLLIFRGPLAGWLRSLRVPPGWITVITRAGPLIVVIAGVLIVGATGLEERGVVVVGEIPKGLPVLSVPEVSWDAVRELLPIALVISFVGYIESYSIARALAARDREKIRPNQELIALGVANLGGAVTGAFPTTGGFSRSAVAADAGGRSGLTSIVASIMIGATVLVLTPLLHDLPRAVLSAIIVVAVMRLVDWRGFLQIWRYDRLDGLVALASFGSVLVIGVEVGILIGAGSAFVLYLWRASRPHVAVVGRLEGTEAYRNVLRHDTVVHPEVAVVRIDESLTFATASALEERLIGIVSERPGLRALILECVAVNHIDATGLDALAEIDGRLEAAGIELHLCELKGPVRDRLEAGGFVEFFGERRLHASTHQAMRYLGAAD